MGRPSLRHAGASRPLPGENANGDQWIVQEGPAGVRVALIDGLGHGTEAEAAALAARQVLETFPDLDLVDALLRCDAALRGTRGAAASILSIDPSGSLLRFAGVGNVEGSIHGTGHERRFSPDRGILGRGIRQPHLTEFPLDGDWTVLVYSDGVRARIASTLAAGMSAMQIADRILSEAARPTDDATVVVVQGQRED